MRGKLYYYNLYMIGRKEPYRLTEEEGINIVKIIAGGQQSKLIILRSRNLIINLSSVSHLSREVVKEAIVNQYDGKTIAEKEIEVELTPKQINARNALKRLLGKDNENLLGEKTGKN